MPYSTVTTKGQTTIPGEIRSAFNIEPGDRLEYFIEGDHITVRVHGGLAALKGALASDKGRGMSFPQIRKAAAASAKKSRR